MEFKSKKLENVYNLIFGKAEESEEPKVENVETSENVEQKFLDATLEDGTMVQIEPSLEVGAAVIVIDAEGNPIAAPDGEHTLLDGTVIETAEGLITNIEEAEAEEVEAKDYEEKEEEMSNDTTETQEQKVKKVVESIIKESHFAKSEAIEEAKKELREEFKAALAAEVEAISKAMFGAFEEFGKEEAEEPKAKPAKFNTKKKKSWVDNFKG